MKNVHLITTERESNLAYYQESTSYDKPILVHLTHIKNGSDYKNQFIYVTNDENVKLNDYFCSKGILYKVTDDRLLMLTEVNQSKKVSLTNDPTLISEGVQEISEEFLKEFVKSPIDYVEVEEFNAYGVDNWQYIVNFPQKENNSYERFLESIKKYKSISLDEYERQEAESYRRNEKLYTEEDLFNATLEALDLGMTIRQNQLNGTDTKSGKELHKEWFDKFREKE